MTAFIYRGQPLAVSGYADISRDMRPNGKYGPLVQSILDETEPWENGENPIEQKKFQEFIWPMAVSIPATTPRVWGVHIGHHARQPGLSPFAMRRIDWKDAGRITVELEGSGDSPRLTRVYGGDYTPPLPWMASAKDALGGVPACREYWQTHAFFSYSSNFVLIKSGTRTDIAPYWFNAPPE